MADRSAVMTEASQKIKELLEAGGDALEEVQRIGAAGSVSYAKTGDAFGRLSRRPCALALGDRLLSELGDGCPAPCHSLAVVSDALDIIALPLPSAQLREKLDAERKQHIVVCKEVARLTAESSTSPLSLWKVYGLHSGLHRVPHSLAQPAASIAAFDMEVFWACPPSSSMLRRAMAGLRAEGGRDDGVEGALQTRLLDSWEDLHVLRKHVQAPPLPSLGPDQRSLSVPTVCQRIGVCVW